jgi:hypothetical protein
MEGYPPGVYKDMRYNKLKSIRLELSRLYELYKNDEIDDKKFKSSIYCLTQLAGVIKDETLDKIELIEKYLKERGSNE